MIIIIIIQLHNIAFLPFVEEGKCDSGVFIENNTWAREDIEFIFECSHRYRTSERSEPVRYRM